MRKLFDKIEAVKQKGIGDCKATTITKENRVLVIGDLHIPFELEGYLDFCNDIKKKYKCNKILFVGDEHDHHAISYHESDPDGLSSGDEYSLSKSRLQAWYKAFPEASICIGNHSALPFRKAKTHGLSKHFFKDFRQLWEAPEGWYWDDAFIVDGVIYEHGLGNTGSNAHYTRALQNMQSTVIGHNHSVAGISYIASNDRLIFGMSVGCGIDRKSYAMAYGKHFPKKPIISCGVVLNNGTLPIIETMKL